jgi:hypothetical protein
MRMNTSTLTAKLGLLLIAIGFSTPSIGVSTISSNTLSSGGIDEKIDILPEKLINPLNESGNFIRYSNHDSYLPFAIDYLDRWEKSAYDLPEHAIKQIQSFIMSYQETNINALLQVERSRFPPYIFDQVRELLLDMPKMRSPIFYPLLLKSNQISTLQGQYLRFSEDLVLMPGYDKNTDFVFQILDKRKQSDEVLVMLKVDSINTYSVTTLSAAPDNVDFILNSRNKIYKVASVRSSQHSLYEHEVKLQEKNLDQIEFEGKTLSLNSHRLHTCE